MIGLYNFIVKIVCWLHWQTGRRLRLLFLKALNPGFSTRGHMVLQKGVRVVCPPGGTITLSGPLWIDRYCALHAYAGGRLSIGPRTSVSPFTIIAAMQEVIIGKDCMIAESVSIRDHDHSYIDASMPMREQGWVVRPIRIGNNVWIGNKVTVMKGCTIGDNVIIGANSVVTRDIPSNSVAYGVPARVMRSLYPKENNG